MNKKYYLRVIDNILKQSLQVSGGRISYTTDDDIHIVPIGCPGP